MLKVALLILMACICEGKEPNENGKLKREESCMTLIEHMPKMDRKRFEETVSLRPDLRKRELQEKLLEKAFNYCMTRISDSQIKEILEFRPKKFRNFFELVPLEVENINNPEDLALDPDWNTMKKEIRSRLKRNRGKRFTNLPNDL
ncbi:unnamed protein product [Blepharisma stoltei]|uniref:DUF4476 domain-containing protein n=1 Tax=Blepharisma stoltei TaxID=1481888 RepID=A0AAU9ID19_9CILI|nr:unnamed protein product [Blepharisma stoltei]